MKKYIVSARKYRPTRFSEVKGQEHVTQTLRNAIRNGQVASALLFRGPRGCGKTTSARLLAKVLNCNAPTAEGEPCNQCDYCQQFQKGTSLYVHELDAASYNSADDMRRIVEQTRYHPPHGKKNIIMIDEAHMLSNAAHNVLLKPLEDTPPHVVFMLITTEKHKIIPTVTSRCQVFDFSRIQEKEIITQLEEVAQKEKITFEPTALALISQHAEGSLRDALSTFDLIATYQSDHTVTYEAVLEHLHLLDDPFYFDITDALQQGKLSTLIKMYDDIIRKGFNGQDFITGFSQYLRNLLLLKTHASPALLKVPQNIYLRYKEKAASLSTATLYELLGIVQEADLHYKSTLSPQIFVELMLLKAAQVCHPHLGEKKQGEVTYTPPPASLATPAMVGEPESKDYTTSPPPSKPKAQPLPQTQSPSTSSPKTTPPQKAPTRYTKPPQSPPLSIAALQAQLQQPLNIKNKSPESPSPKTQPQSENKPTSPSTPPPPLTEALLRPHWDAYKKLLREKGENSALTLLNQPFTLQNHTIKIRLANHIQEKESLHYKEPLLQYLREKLHHPDLTITLLPPQESATPPPKAIPSPQQIWEQMASQYPQAKVLKEKLDLTY